MTFYMLVFIAFLNGQPTEPVMGAFTDRTTCETAYGLILTSASKNVDVSGWAVPAMCVPVTEEKKT